MKSQNNQIILDLEIFLHDIIEKCIFEIRTSNETGKKAIFRRTLSSKRNQLNAAQSISLALSITTPTKFSFKLQKVFPKWKGFSYQSMYFRYSSKLS